VPWTSKAQRLFDESHLPTAEQKILLYLKGKELLLKNGYTDIGMDHFALPLTNCTKHGRREDYTGTLWVTPPALQSFYWVWVYQVSVKRGMLLHKTTKHFMNIMRR
jgi:hypothetical protein